MLFLDFVRYPYPIEFLLAILQEEITLQKQVVRTRILSELNSYSSEALNAWSDSIQNKVMASDLFARSQSIGLYRSLPTEVDTQILFEEALKQGKRIACPKVKSAQDPLYFFWVENAQQMSCSKWGMMEPDEKLGARSAFLSEMDLLIIPGLAFDRKGYRLGRGKSFYDRTLKNFFGQRLGLAYSFQIFDELPREAWDQKINWLVSEEEWIQVGEDF